MYRKIKNSVFNLIRDDDVNNWKSNLFDFLIILLIIINVITVIIETFDITPQQEKIINVIEKISIVIFSIEYLLRLWTSDLIRPETNCVKARLRYMVSFMAIIDLISILPAYIPFIISVDLRVLRALRIVRLFRLFKVSRYTTAFSTIAAVFRKKSYQIISSFFVVGLLMIISSILMYNVEHDVQPDKFKNAFSGLWWAVATLTTVGYGDIYPITVIGKILSSVIALLGIGLVAIPTGIISAGFVEVVTEPESKKHSEKCYCPYCGKKLE